MAAQPLPSLASVPKLAGKTLTRAKAALRAASCKLGRVHEPRAREGAERTALVVRSSTPAAGAKPASGKVNLVLGPKPRKGGRASPGAAG